MAGSYRPDCMSEYISIWGSCTCCMCSVLILHHVVFLLWQTDTFQESLSFGLRPNIVCLSAITLYVCLRLPVHARVWSATIISKAYTSSAFFVLVLVSCGSLKFIAFISYVHVHSLLTSLWISFAKFKFSVNFPFIFLLQRSFSCSCTRWLRSRIRSTSTSPEYSPTPRSCSRPPSSAAMLSFLWLFETHGFSSSGAFLFAVTVWHTAS